MAAEPSPAPPLAALGRDDRPLTALLAVTMLLPALLIGGVHPGSQILTLAVAGLAGVLLWMYRRTHPKRGTVIPPLPLLAMGLPLAFTLMQLVPLPPSLLRAFSPQAAELWAFADEGAARWHPLSLSPPATRLEIAKQVTYLILLVVGANFLRRPRRAGLVVRAFFVGGVLLATVGIVQRVFHLHRILGLYRPDWSQSFMATFVDPNHAAGFFLLVIGCGVGLALTLHGRQRAVCLAAVGLPVSALLFTASRGGLVGLLLLILVIVILGVGEKRTRREAAMLAGGVVALLFVGLLNTYDEISARVTQLLDTPFGANQKLLAWRDAFTMSRDFPWTGIGRGAFQDVFPHYKQFDMGVTVTHPENIVIQSLTEWGYPLTMAALALTVGFVLVLLFNKKIDALGRGIAAGLLALLVQNLFDFNLEFPGTAAPAALLIGLLCAQTAPKAERQGSRARSLERLQARLVLGGVALAGPLALLVGWGGARHALRTEDRHLAMLLRTAPALPAAAREAEQAVQGHPADYRTHLSTGLLYLKFADPHGLRHLNAAMALNRLDRVSHLAAARELAASGHRDQAALEYRSAFERGLSLTDVTLTELLERCGAPAARAHGVPATPEAQLVLAAFLERRHDADGAREAYHDLLTLPGLGDPTRLAALRALVRLDAAHRLERARELARVSPVPGDVAVAAEAARKAGRADLAEQLYLDALGRFPADWSVVQPAADVLLARGSLPWAARALAEASEAIHDPPVRMAALEKLADVQERLGQAQSAARSRMAAERLRVSLRVPR